MPKEAITAKKANRLPRIFPICRFGNPYCNVYIGPPMNFPFLPLILYFTDNILSANFVESPAKAASTIQRSAPGPPSIMAVATPTIFPVPIVAASSVVSEDSGEIPPSFASLSPPITHRRAYPRFRSGRNCIRTSKYSPVPIINTSMPGPQTILSIRFNNCAIYVPASSPLQELYDSIVLFMSHYPQWTKGHTVGEEPIFAPASLLSFRVRPVRVNQAPRRDKN